MEMNMHNFNLCLLGLISIKWTWYILFWIIYHLTSFSDSIMLNKGIKTINLRVEVIYA